MVWVSSPWTFAPPPGLGQEEYRSAKNQRPNPDGFPLLRGAIIRWLLISFQGVCVHVYKPKEFYVNIEAWPDDLCYLSLFRYWWSFVYVDCIGDYGAFTSNPTALLFTCDWDDSVYKWRVTVMKVCTNDVWLGWQCVQMTCDCDNIVYKWRVTGMTVCTNDVWLW